MNDEKIEEKKIPPGWGQDSLSEFIENAWHNTFATFHNVKDWYSILKDIHLVFDAITHNIDRTPDWFASFFLFRSHSAYLGSVRLALSGQTPETYIVLRGCLGNALYGFYVSRNAESREIWLRRRDEIEYCDQRLAFFHPGVGAPLAAGLLEKAIAYGCRKFMVCGGCGVLDKHMAVGSLLVVSSAIRDEGVSYHYLPPSRCAPLPFRSPSP
ncbi:MAG: hypothetical protein RBU31_05045 [Syntrophales bacterium]|jgi:hypothetical protein|nr:hypothetical protein [Syntrophales bacterium]